MSCVCDGFELRSGLKAYVSLKAVGTVERANAVVKAFFGLGIRHTLPFAYVYK
jgi:hypothetical protein